MSRVTNDPFRQYARRVDPVPDDETVQIFVKGGRAKRIHFIVFRVPSAQEFVLRHLANATDEDRRFAERWFAQDDFWSTIPRDCIRKFGSGDAGKHSYFWWQAKVGRYIDDPLIQLELEMMIDASRTDALGIQL